jgi:hypothetical protein
LMGEGIQVYLFCDIWGELTVCLISIWWLQILGKSGSN